MTLRSLAIDRRSAAMSVFISAIIFKTLKKGSIFADLIEFSGQIGKEQGGLSLEIKQEGEYGN